MHRLNTSMEVGRRPQIGHSTLTRSVKRYRDTISRGCIESPFALPLNESSIAFVRLQLLLKLRKQTRLRSLDKSRQFAGRNIRRLGAMDAETAIAEQITTAQEFLRAWLIEHNL